MRWTIGILGVSLGLVACGGGSSGGSGGGGGASASSSSGANSSSNASTSSASTGSASSGASTSSASSSSGSGSSSSGGGGLPFGAVCTMNSDCMSMLCHDYALKGMHCTKTCATDVDCPMGSKCGGMMVCSVP